MKRTLSPVVVCTALLLAILPLALRNDFAWDVAIRTCINAMVAVSLSLLIGYAGQVSLGHAGFFGLGGYGSALLCSRYGWDPLAAMVVAGCASAFVANVLARPILRLKGHYLAMATLGLGAIATIVFGNESWLTGGPDGMAVPAFRMGPLAFGGIGAWYALVAVLLVLTLLAVDNIVNSAFGRALRGLHGAETAAQCMGVDTASHKVAMFVFSAFVASIAGSLSAHYVGFITPQTASTLKSVEFVTMVVVGGMGSVSGGLVGAVLFTLLPQLVADYEGYELALSGAVLILSLVFMPRGIVPGMQDLARRLFRRGGGSRTGSPNTEVDVEHA